MTVSSTTNRISYSGDGTTVSFPFSYYFQVQADLVVLLVEIATGIETVQTLNSDYTISGTTTNGIYPNGANVLFTLSPSVLYNVVIYRSPALTQGIDLVENDALPAETLEQGLDKAIIVAQRLDERMDRALVLSEGFTGTFNTTLPADIGTPDASIIVNPTGDGFIVGPTAASITGAAASAAAAAASALDALASANLAEEWATNTTTIVDTTDYSSKEYAIGIQNRGLVNGGSSKDWANYLGGTVDDTEYSAKKYADDAAASAVAAQLIADSVVWSSVVQVTPAMSPLTVSTGDGGTLFVCNTTLGNITINLPLIATLSLPFTVAVKKSVAANTVIINCDASDTIDTVLTTLNITQQNGGFTLTADDTASPDNWASQAYNQLTISGAVVGTTDIQTLSNKTFSDAITLAEITTPTTPSSGFRKIYPKNDGYFYQKTSAGVESKFGAGGAGGINYITNPDAESATTGWSTYADAAAIRPVDMTAGTASLTFARTTGSPLRDVGMFVLTKAAANRQGQGVSTPFTIARADTYGMLQISFDYVVNTGYVTGDLRCYVYDITNAVLIEPINVEIQAATNPAKHVAYFQASNSTSYRFGFHIATVSAVTYTFNFDTVVVGPQQISKGSFISSWQPFTTASFTGFGTVTNLALYQRRVGSTLEVKGTFDSGTPTAVEARFNLPTGLSLDTSVIGTSPLLCGDWTRESATTSQVKQGKFFATTASLTGLSYSIDEYAQNFNTSTRSLATNVATAAGKQYVNITGVPILGWGAGVTLASESSNKIVGFRAGMTSGQTIPTNAVAVINFTNITGTNLYDTTGGYDTSGPSWNVTESGYYTIRLRTYYQSVTSLERMFVRLYKNGVQIAQGSGNADTSNNVELETSGTFYLIKGDVLNVFAQSTSDTSYTIDNTLVNTYWEAMKIQGNQTIGYDEVVACAYSTNAGQVIPNATVTTVLFEDKAFDTHGSYNTSTGIFTAPVAGQYKVDAHMTYDPSGSWTIAEEAYGYIYVNGTQITTHRYALPATSGSSIAVGAIAFATVDLVKGSTVDIRTYQSTGAGAALQAGATSNRMSITRIK